MRSHLQPADLRALSRLGIDAVIGIARLVEAVHHSVSRVAPPLGAAPAGRTRGIPGLVYRSVHGVTRAVGGGLDFALDRLLPLLERRAGAPLPPSDEREAVLAALNGVLGDHLAATDSSLALPMQLRYLGRPLTLQADAIAAVVPAPSDRLLLRVHGLCMNERQWRQRALRAAGLPADAPTDAPADPWFALARELGCTLLDLNYNSGRHVSANGRELAALLDQLVQQWPLPVAAITIVGHSMGGLVARSACAQAAASNAAAPARPADRAGARAAGGDADPSRPATDAAAERVADPAPARSSASMPESVHAADARADARAPTPALMPGPDLTPDPAAGWLPRLRTLVFLGTPHHGAPLERGGSWVDLLLGASPYSAPFARLGQLRSAGITDLRHGNVTEADWQGRSRFARGDARVPLPLPTGVDCFAIAASTGRQAGDLGDRVLGDGLVPVASALGRHADAARTLAFAADHSLVLYGRNHLDLLGDAEVLAQLRRWLAPAAAAGRVPQRSPR